MVVSSERFAALYSAGARVMKQAIIAPADIKLINTDWEVTYSCVRIVARQMAILVYIAHFKLKAYRN